MTIKLHIAIIEARGLKGIGLLNRPQDPYCVLTLVGHGEPQQARSEVAPKTNTPRWESPAFIFTLLNITGMPLELSVWNDSTNTLSATCTIPLKDLDGTGLPDAEKDSWFDLYNGKLSVGQIRLLSAIKSSDDKVAADVIQSASGFQFTKGACIGKGSFGKVYVALDLTSGSLLAVKELNILDIPADDQRSIEQEVRALSIMQHSNIVSYIGTHINEQTISILMEFCPGGSISKALSVFGAFPEVIIVKYTQQILQGLKFLHENRIIHRDIKGGNIFLAPNGVVKIGDLGASVSLTKVDASIPGDTPLQGSPFWMAPEVVLQAEVGAKSDVWSLGMTVIEMATGLHPWHGIQANKFTVMFEVAHGNSLPPLPPSMSAPMHEFVSLCLQRDPAKRPTAAALAKHPWLCAT